jgi:hypothetical protein
MRSARAAFSRKRAPKSAEPLSSPTTSSSMSVGVDRQLVGRGRRVGVGQVERDSVVRPDRLHVEVERLPQLRCEREPPRRVNAAAERREDADAPVADLVAEALDHDGAVRRHDAGRGGLLVEEREEVARGLLVERVLVAKPSERLLSGSEDDLARHLPDRCAELVRPADALAPSRTAPPPARRAPARRSRRSRVISSIRHDDAPSRNVCPARAS